VKIANFDCATGIDPSRSEHSCIRRGCMELHLIKQKRLVVGFVAVGLKSRLED